MLLTVSQIAKTFGGEELLSGVAFRLAAREKVALVGRNGTGKTTLLKIITGQLEPDAGHVSIARGAKVGYLRQDAPVAEGGLVIQEVQAAVAGQTAMRARLEELGRRIEAGATEEDLEEYALLHEHFLESEGYSAERDVRVVLQRMGFEPEEFDKATATLSGGEKTRLAIARLLLEEPDLLILDEPTNHLDLQATEWLEGWIRAYHGAILLVSHDRTFLENTAERVLEVQGGRVKAYPGPFSKYLELRAMDEARQAEVAKRQEQEIAKLDEYVRRFINSQRTAQARGREKLKNRLIDSRVEAPKNDRGMQAGFGKARRSGDIVASCERLSMGFPKGTANPGGEAILFRDLDWTVRWGERWGVIGENGAGKSTLVRLVLGLADPLSGRARLGASVVAGYFSQDTSDLDGDRSPLDTLCYDDGLAPAEARNLLGRFLITGDDVYRPIRTLSGGERNKLSLARLTSRSPNLLVLDEPTNHLDMDSREALAQVLKEFGGTLILVSHDRWLLGQVTDHTLDLRRSGVVQHPGSYSQYRASAHEAAPAPARPNHGAPSATALTPRELSKEIERMEKEVARLESEVSHGEKALRDLEAQLADLPPDADVFALTSRHQRLQEEVAERLGLWEASATRLEELLALR